LYVKHLDSAVPRPLKELKAFSRVAIAPGETKPVTLEVDAGQLAYWDVKRQKFVVEADRIELMIGASSQDIRLRTQLQIVE
jgi:beta-glucosidase